MIKKPFSRKILAITGIIAVVILAGFYLWQHYKYRVADTALEDAISKDSLYHLSYDYLRFDEVNGNAVLKNVRVIPDTARVITMSPEALPSILLDIQVNSITIKGVQTMKALRGKDVVGDTVIINHPQVTMYVLKPLKKNTELEVEAREVYKEILGSLEKVKVGFVLIDSIHVKAVQFRSGKKDFDFINGNIQLTDVLIDSAHNNDSSRILFSKKASFTVDQFYSFNNDRPELIVSNVAFSGELKTIVFERIVLNRFNDAAGEGKMLLDASTLKVAGVNTNAIVKDKNLVVDSIQCGQIDIYEPPKENLPDIKAVSKEQPQSDSASGFQNVYSIALRYLAFDNVNFKATQARNFDLGKIQFQLQDVAADRVALLKKNPLQYVNEVNLEIAYMKFTSGDKQYKYGLDDIRINSRTKSLKIGSAYSTPVLSETAFAKHYKYQRDRFDASMKGITLHGIRMNDLFNNKLVATGLTVSQTSLKLYRDLTRPLEQKSKVGNYPSQLLKKLDFPVHITKASLPSVYVSYREKQVNSGEVGTVTFTQTSLDVSNITNIDSEINKNQVLTVGFKAKALGPIPLNGNFYFYMKSNNGSFRAKGSTGSFDALALNKIALPMAMVRIKSGRINSIDFDFKGDDSGASGPMTMAYDNLKIDILKKDGDSEELKKRGFLSLLANIVIVNNNPSNGKLREAEAKRERDVYKSFFNLVWKTLFEGMKETLGAP